MLAKLNADMDKEEDDIAETQRVAENLEKLIEDLQEEQTSPENGEMAAEDSDHCEDAEKLAISIIEDTIHRTRRNLRVDVVTSGEAKGIRRGIETNS